MLLTARLNVMTSIIELQRARQEVNRDVNTMKLGVIPGVNLRQLNDYLAQMEAELASIPPKPQQREGPPDAPTNR